MIFFKHLNDTNGHLAGDLVLKNVADIIADSVREGDVAARFGGEEFLIMLHAAGASDVFSIAERLRKSIQDHSSWYNGKEIRVTASMGCATYTGQEGITREGLVQIADSALYRSKKNGRNCTSTAGAGLLQRAKNLDSLLSSVV